MADKKERAIRLLKLHALAAALQERVDKEPGQAAQAELEQILAQIKALEDQDARQQDEIDDLDSRIDALERRLTELEARPPDIHVHGGGGIYVPPAQAQPIFNSYFPGGWQ